MTARRRPTEKQLRDAWVAFYVTLNERFLLPLELRIELADAYAKCLKCPAYRHESRHSPRREKG